MSRVIIAPAPVQTRDIIMISSQVFMLANLGIWVAIVVLLALEERRSRRRYHGRHRGVRYRRITSDEVLKMIEKAVTSPLDKRAEMD